MSRFLHPDAEQAAKAYLGVVDLGEPLGSGLDGVVYSTSRSTAIKVYSNPSKFERELAIYRRLRSHDVSQIQGFNVPQLINFNVELKVIEMSVVRPPYVLDFAKSSLDDQPDYPADVWGEWRRRIRREFEDRWPVAISIYEELRWKYGIYHEDISPRNVNFGED